MSKLFEAMWAEVDALKQLDCWQETEGPDNTNVLHTKIVLHRKRNQFGDKEKYNAGLEVCGSEEEDNVNDWFSPVVYYTLIKLLLFFGHSMGWKMRPFDIQNAFLNEKSERPVYAELSRHLFTNAKRYIVFMKLQRSLYGAKVASKICFSLITGKLADAGMKEMQSATCFSKTIAL